MRRNSLHYYHPVGACKMGPDSDPAAVVDSTGKVHGLDNLYVADASIMPVVPRANTNLPTLMLAERIVASPRLAGMQVRGLRPVQTFTPSLKATPRFSPACGACRALPTPPPITTLESCAPALSVQT